jgi:hypothetical protein
VTSLEPRTPHQPGKLQKLSKNDYVFTLFIFRVNGNCKDLSADFSIECKRSTGGCSKYGAVPSSPGIGDVRVAQFSPNHLADSAELSGKNPDYVCENLGKTAVGMAFGRLSVV